MSSCGVSLDWKVPLISGWLPSVVNLCLGFNYVAVKRDGADLFLDQHAHRLRLRNAVASIANHILFQSQLIRCSTNSYSRFAVVFDYVRPQMIAMTLRRVTLYPRIVMQAGSLAICAVAATWLFERAFDMVFTI